MGEGEERPSLHTMTIWEEREREEGSGNWRGERERGEV